MFSHSQSLQQIKESLLAKIERQIREDYMRRFLRTKGEWQKAQQFIDTLKNLEKKNNECNPFNNEQIIINAVARELGQFGKLDKELRIVLAETACEHIGIRKSDLDENAIREANRYTMLLFSVDDEDAKISLAGNYIKAHQQLCVNDMEFLALKK